MAIDKFFNNIQDKLIKDILENHGIVNSATNLNKIIGDYLENDIVIHKTAKVSENAVIKGPVYIGENVIIEDFAYIKGPAIVLDNALIGKSAFIRNSSIIGSNTVVGNGCEINNSIIMNDSMISHYNFIGYSLIGSNVSFGIFTTCLVFLLKNKEINIASEKVHIPKFVSDVNNNVDVFGAVIGDNCRVGAQVLLNPGVFLMNSCIVYPQLCLKAGLYKEKTKIYIPKYYNSATRCNMKSIA